MDDAAFLPEEPMATSPIPPMKLDRLKKEELGWEPAAAAAAGEGGGGFVSGSNPSESGSPPGPLTAAVCTAVCTAVAPAIAASALAQKWRSIAPPGCHIDDDGCVPPAAPVSVAAAAGELLVLPLLPGPPIVAAAAAAVGDCCWPTVPPRICVARLMSRMSLAGSESTKPVWKANWLVEDEEETGKLLRPPPSGSSAMLTAGAVTAASAAGRRAPLVATAEGDFVCSPAEDVLTSPSALPAKDESVACRACWPMASAVGAEVKEGSSGPAVSRASCSAASSSLMSSVYS